MKNFLTSFLGSLAAMFVASLLFIFIIVALIPEEKQFKAKENSVLHMKLDKPVLERGSNNPFENFSFDGENSMPVGLDDIIANLEKAKADSNIRGIFLEISTVNAGMATTEEIRNALLDFKSSGKFIYAYSEVMDHKAYYLASVADRVMLNPQGLITHAGLSAQLMFFKGMLEKLEVEAQIFRHGKFKSAIEPFMLDKMSEANREQVEKYLGSLWAHMLQGISESRKIPVEELMKMADDMRVQNAGDCMKFKLADDTLYKDQVLAELRTKLGIKENKKISMVELGKYSKTPKGKKEKLSQKKIAVIYAVGDINSGEGNDESIGSERISRAIREARLDSSVKAIVLRVNSPGGSALASDVMWREVVLARASKPIIVSMGDVAASGGYYISCGADRIFAQPNTITGSIGVFGMLPNMQKMFANKFGITIDTVNTNKHSDLGSVFRSVSETEGLVIQKGVEDIYQVFLHRVAAGRKMSVAAVDSIGQGRVWSGADALNLGLVDALGGLKDAIKYAAEKVGTKEYRIIYLPKQKKPFEEFMSELKGEGEDQARQFLRNELGDQYTMVLGFRKLCAMKGVQARLPFEFIIN
ncbi:MAG: signal peptide peptidase SppA [Bacteroidia bacterium]|nr:signal peptide peptidase SppA [Bacteroidia bacterium]